jgi:hypothetical protein
MCILQISGSVRSEPQRRLVTKSTTQSRATGVNSASFLHHQQGGVRERIVLFRRPSTAPGKYPLDRAPRPRSPEWHDGKGLPKISLCPMMKGRSLKFPRMSNGASSIRLGY